MSSVLIGYTTGEGQTGLIAETLARHLRDAALAVDLFDLSEKRDIQLEGYDACILGGSIHVGRHQKALRRFVLARRDVLNAKHAAFFSVSGSASRADGVPAAQELANRFLAETGFKPNRMTVFAGAIKFTQYNWLVRWMMKQIVGRAGGNTDTSRDHEYTDWEAVEQFAKQFAADLAPGSDPDARAPKHHAASTATPAAGPM